MRSPVLALGDATEELVHVDYRSEEHRFYNPVQQFALNTPYGAPEDGACGRVSYSGFHVAGLEDNPQRFADAVFPEHCTGSLTGQEKVLLYTLLDLGSCVRALPQRPVCVPRTCDDYPDGCGAIPDGCGGLLDCGASFYGPI